MAGPTAVRVLNRATAISYLADAISPGANASVFAERSTTSHARVQCAAIPAQMSFRSWYSEPMARMLFQITEHTTGRQLS